MKGMAPCLDRILTYTEANPSATEYYIREEREAQELLIAMAAVLDKASKELTVVAERSAYLTQARIYKEAVQQGQALDLFRAMTEGDQLHIFGVALVPARIETARSVH